MGAGSTSYTRTPVSVPRLAGLALRSVLWLARSVLGGPLRRKMVRDSGVLSLDHAALDVSPASIPPVDLDGRRVSASAGDEENSTNRISLESVWAHFDTTVERETIARFATRYRRSGLTPIDVAERVIAAIADSEKRAPAMRAFIAHDADDVMKSARESAARLRAGQPRGPLEGVPIAVKDELDQMPYRTTVGRRFGALAKEDATVVARLRAAGALLIGKTNMHEIGIGVTGLNPHHGTARNPHDPARHTGGSSSGSAAAVAMGLCPAALGADGGGSIRIPSAFCGLVGLKPTFGRVSEYGAAPLCSSLAHLGPIALTVADAALLYAAIAGPDPKDPVTLARPAPTVAPRWPDLRSVRVGVFQEWFEDAEPGVVRACKEALGALTERGATLVDVEVPDIELARLAHLVTIGSEMLVSQEPHFAEHWGDYGFDTRLLFTLVSSFPPSLYLSAQRVRARVAAAFRTMFARVDVLATPSTGCTAPLVPQDALSSGESNLELFDAVMRFAPIPNLIGLPALSVPAGEVGGLPVGLQLVAAPWDESALLQLGSVVEAAAAARSPRVHYRVLDESS
jgi:Asp-tRNA(Asn)/Glu-tRNA(Gln) amidotransferase A subunit family amidase